MKKLCKLKNEIFAPEEGNVYYWMNRYVDLQDEFEEYKVNKEREFKIMQKNCKKI